MYLLQYGQKTRKLMKKKYCKLPYLNNIVVFIILLNEYNKLIDNYQNVIGEDVYSVKSKESIALL